VVLAAHSEGLRASAKVSTVPETRSARRFMGDPL